LELCKYFLQQIPITGFKIEVGRGNWDDSAIEEICKRVGCELQLTPGVLEAAKRHVRDEMGALKLVKDRRNHLAHGSLSFVDSSDGVTVRELDALATAVGDYLRETVECFDEFINQEVVARQSQLGKKKVVTSR
jgi:hypothetical protein